MTLTIPSVHFPAFEASLPSMEGKTVAITGTTSGTGRVAASTVAKLGGKVLVLNRRSARATESTARSARRSRRPRSTRSSAT